MLLLSGNPQLESAFTTHGQTQLPALVLYVHFSCLGIAQGSTSCPDSGVPPVPMLKQQNQDTQLHCDCEGEEIELELAQFCHSV